MDYDISSCKLDVYMMYKLMCNCPWTIRQVIKLNLILLCNIKLKQAYYKKWFSVLFTYKVTE